MARRDEILRSFLEHDKLKNEYKLSEKDIPNTVREAINSEQAIIGTIAKIVEKLESSETIRDIDIFKMITNSLNLNTTK